MTATPRATYRVQLGPGFTFDQAAAIAPYLAELGVSHAYFSPYLQAAPGSSHGYDVADPSGVNLELGGPEAHARLCAALGKAGLGQVLDIVPNHMAVVPENRWWWDVLENGPSSRYALYFDISWEPPERKLRNTILLPVLGDHYGRVLEGGELTLHRSGGEFEVRYFDHRFPIAPSTLSPVLAESARRSAVSELAVLAAAFADLPRLAPDEYEAALARHQRKEELKQRLAAVAEEPPVAAELDAVLAEVSADPDRLDALLEAQNYRLARWQVGDYELDYRRFFDVDTLVAIRMEDQRVFQDTHRLVLGWLAEGVLDGLRIDHPDGLRDPEGYFARLAGAAPGAWLVAEKILEPGERLPETWPVAGTTGYDFASNALQLLIDERGEAPLTSFYEEFASAGFDYGELVHACKHMVMREILATDLSRLAALLVRVCESTRRYRDYARVELLGALRELVACLPVYRTYVLPGQVSEADRRHLAQARAEAGRRRPDLDPELLDFLLAVLLGEAGEGGARDELVARFQQTSGPVMAKGVEDTAFYRFNRLVALNEVGSDPGRFGLDPGRFHEAAAEQARAWPAAMLSTSTHDTKRSEDVRARLAVLSERPDQWIAAVRRWSGLNERHRRNDLPDRNDEYLLYQTLVGAWPLELERAQAYLRKATREAKLHTSWTAPDQAYDEAVAGFVGGVLGDLGFTAELARFVEGIADAGWSNALALKLMKLTWPGVPDLYQGSELWDLSLVDPDNRRPVDYGLRRRLVAEVRAMSGAEAWARRAEGLPKLLVVQRALQLRARRPELLGAGAAYQPLEVAGPAARHGFAYLRGGAAATLVTRFPATLAGWGGTVLRLPPGTWRDELGGGEWKGGEIPVAEVLSSLPVALLVKG